MSKTAPNHTTAVTISANPQGGEPVRPTPSQAPPLEETDPAGLNARRSADAIWKFQEAYTIQETPPLDFLAHAVKPLEVRRVTEAAEACLDPGPLVEGAGEAVPRLGDAEPCDPVRHAMVDTLERPTTIAVRASEQRLRLLDKVGALQAGVDASRTANTRNSIEKMLTHQLAASHRAAMHLLGFIPGLDGGDRSRSMPVAEVARLANAAARLMDSYANGCLVLQKLQTGGTQRVVVQHQQLAVTQNGPAVVINRPRRPRRRMTGGREGGGPKHAK
jgi:hypothetical protein